MKTDYLYLEFVEQGLMKPSLIEKILNTVFYSFLANKGLERVQDRIKYWRIELNPKGIQAIV